jgi:hypothetical protein
MAAFDWAVKLARRLRPEPSAAAPSPQPPAAADPHAAMADALLALGFDADAYLRDYPVLAPMTAWECARHFHVYGRADWLRIRFARPFAETQSRIEALDLTDAQKDQLRLDLAASALWQADTSGSDPAQIAKLLRPSPAYRPLAIISDSHGLFYLTEEVLWAGRWLPVPLLCTGASARGLGNPQSRAKAGERIRAHLKRLEGDLAHGAVLLKFGQVDLEFVCDYRRIRDGRRAFDPAHAAAFARESARRYLAFLRDLRAGTPLTLIVTAALPPSLNDAALREGYMNAHIVELHAELSPEALRAELQKLEMPDWKARTELAHIFNAELSQGCAEAGLVFYDDFTPLLGPDGVISPDLLIWHGGTDHHLCATSPAARVAAGKISKDLAALAARGWDADH